jgi:hypothetical protein
VLGQYVPSRSQPPQVPLSSEALAVADLGEQLVCCTYLQAKMESIPPKSEEPAGFGPLIKNDGSSLAREDPVEHEWNVTRSQRGAFEAVCS